MNRSNNLIKYQTRHPLKKFFLKKFLKKIVNVIIELKDANKILEVGCGEGFVMQAINKRDPKIAIEGLDISRDSLEIAKKLLPDHKFYQANINNLPLDDNQYDLVMALEILEHLPNHDRALNELSRVTKKYCLISVPWEPFFSLGNLLSGKNISRLGQDKEHLQFWTKSKITALVSRYFDIIFVKISFPWTIILAKKKL